MKQFAAFIKKEFYHIFRDKTTMAILLLLPILMLILFGYAITTEVKNSNIAVINPSNDFLSNKIINRIQNSPYFSVVKQLNSPSEIESEFKKGSIKMAIVFDQHFQTSIESGLPSQIAIIIDAADPNLALSINSYANQIINQEISELNKNNTTPYFIKPHIKMLYNPEMKGAYNFVPGVMGMILMLICAMMTSISIAREKEMGTMEILLVSPVKPIFIIIAKTIPYLVISLINLITILLLSVFMLKVPIAGNFVALITFSLIYIFVNLSLGLVISSIVDSQLVALLISGMVLMLPVIMLSGMMFPIENMPQFFQYLSNILPAKWFILGVKKIMIKGLGFQSIIIEMGILISMIVFFISVSLKKFKYRLE